jgi:hypothetical protein
LKVGDELKYPKYFMLIEHRINFIGQITPICLGRANY